MIHAIYIYFIINAFIAGVTIGNKEGIIFFLIAIFFGIPFYSLIFIYALFEWIVIRVDELLIIRGWYRLLYTDYFGKMDEITIKIRRQQYLGLRKDKTNCNKYERFFLRQIDKKYNYGITKEK